MADRWVVIGTLNGWSGRVNDPDDRAWAKKAQWLAGLFRDEEEAKGWVSEISTLMPPARSPNFIKRSDWLAALDPKYAAVAPDGEHQVYYKIESVSEMNWFPE